MKIIGIDPGLSCTGWGIIKKDAQVLSYIDSGTITTKRTQTLADRLHVLHTNLLQIIKEYQPDTAAIEETFVNKNAQSSLLLGHARGALILTCMISGMNGVEQYAANRIKKTVTGNGHADKHQMTHMLPHIINNLAGNNLTHDMADALAIAICHGYHLTSF